jgi:hypothetical protein
MNIESFSATAFFPSCRCVPSAPAIILRDASSVIWLQVMFEQTPTQYDIIIRNVSAAGARFAHAYLFRLPHDTVGLRMARLKAH